MKIMKGFWIIAIHCISFGKFSDCGGSHLALPKNLAIGAATAAHQVEGAWNVSGKGENVWDWWTHNSPTVATDDHSNADIACNSYYKYQEDVEHIKSIGLDFYRFSISWSRILPTGFTNVINEEGLQYYKNLTAELLANGIEPVVTIYHFDHPEIMEEMGGWTNELIIDWFVEYARIIFQALGASVKMWITINEPQTFCEYGYDGTSQLQLAPGKRTANMGKYLCGHNVLKAHAKTYHMYNKEFRPTQRGRIGMVFPCAGYIPLNKNYATIAETAFQFNCGWMAHPIFIGDYPEIMKRRVAMISKSQGYQQSRLPKFSRQWISIVKGTSDYFGLNHYTSWLVSPEPDEKRGIYKSDNGVMITAHPTWPRSHIWWQNVYPPGFGILLRKIRDEYKNPPLWVMENGYADGGELEDYDRISFHHGYLRELIIAMERDGCNIEGYTIWTLMDNFEWNSGYTQKFGIISVDFNDPERTRSPKMSTTWWANVLAARKLQPVPTRRKSSTIKSRKRPF